MLVSPGVEVKEIDLTNVIPAVSTSIGGYVGTFDWGPVNEAVLVSSEKELASVFGEPTAANAVSFLTAASFLKYGGALKVVRTVDESSALNAGNLGTGALILNDEHFETTTIAAADGKVFARHPGIKGNSIRVMFADDHVWNSSTNNSTSRTLFKANFDYAPTKTNADFGFNDEVHVLVIDTATDEVLEKFQGLSLATDGKKDDGSTLYYVDVINRSSAYIRVNAFGDTTYGSGTPLPYFTDCDVAGATVATTPNHHGIGFRTATDGLLGGGLLGSGTPDYANAVEAIADPEKIDVNLLFCSEADDTLGTLEDELVTTAIARKDCVTFISAPISMVAEATADAKLDLAVAKGGTVNSSYVVVDSSPVYVYNKYQDNYVWIPASGHMAGLCAATDRTTDPWYSPAGYNRGNLLGVTKLSFNPNQAQRDELYKGNVNPIVAMPGHGILLYGDKTSQKKASAFDRINVRRLFIVLEKAIATAAKYQLFEFNDEFTRAMFRNMVEPYLRDVQGRRGITDFRVVCDETNNTGEVIDSNRFVASIFIKPARSINFITLNFIATRTGVDFSEIAGTSVS